MPAPEPSFIGDDREAAREAWIFVGSIAAAFGLMIASLVISAFKNGW